MQFSFLVTDDKKINELAGLAYPMVRLQMKVEVEFAMIDEFFMYNADVVAINFYKNGNDNVKAW